MSAGPSAPRVLHVTAPAPFGGLERVVENLSRGLHEQGVDTTVVAVLDRPNPEHPFVRAVEQSGVEIVPLVIGARDYPGEIRALRELVRARRPSVIHTHGYRSDVTGGWVARQAGIARVSTLHGFTARSLRGRVSEALQLRSLRRFDAVIGVSQIIIERARQSGVSADRLHLVPNAWTSRRDIADRSEARRLLGLPDDAFVAGWVGRLSHEKGADVFLDAFANWNAPNALASIVGDGRERAALETRAASLGIAERVRWHGQRSDAGRLMRAFDVLVLSSRTEGVPMVLLEAMNAGTPIVATAVGGVPSVLDETQARLVPSEAPRSLAEALEDVRANPAAAAERAVRAGERLATDFASGPWLERHLAIYRSATRLPHR